ncbi:ParB/RepB/Spo0J family partition protein [Sphingomonas sp. 3-13AW]|uniref:ParB/RepB/Spo0J family partition protein n=1 Tax=Sphingomonas sp. 3-13AW TaxID=3050450 RepID=UPI003BB7F100
MENGKNKSILISNLVRWDKNPRPQTLMDQNSDIEASIESKGVLLPLIVRAKSGANGMYEVIAGDRRRTTVQHLVDLGRWPADRPVPCLVRTDLGDDADALDVATSENLHLVMHPMNQFIAFNDMFKAGKTVAQIATSYGVTPRTVEQRLSYAKLDPRARDLVLQDKRDLQWASAMTVASADEQAAMLEEIESDPNRYRNAMEVQRRLSTELVSMAYALFDISEVETSLVRKDIFDVAEPSYLPTAEFLRLQDIAVARLVDERKAEGWSRVTVLTDRTFDRWQYIDGVEDKERGEVVFVRHQTGQVVEHSGLALRAEARIQSADTVEDAQAGDALFGEGADDLPPIVGDTAPGATAILENKATTTYLEKNRALVVQAMLMGSDPKLSLAVTILGLLSESAPKLVEGRSFSDMRDIDPESRTRAAVDLHLEAMSRQLRALGVAPDASYDDNMRALLKGERDQLLAIQQVLIATRVSTSLTGIDRLLDVASDLGDVSLSAVWSPDRTYLSTLSSEQLKALATDLLPSRLATKVKGKKPDMVETVFQHIDDAHEEGARFDDAERIAITSWAPNLLGGGRPNQIASPFGEDDGDHLFGDINADDHVEA